jgi:trehalose-phosphatase
MLSLLESDSICAEYSDEIFTEAFLIALTHARKSALILDFDGTLAPFEIDPSSVRPWPGIAELLQQIQGSNRSHPAVVTGRPALDVRRLLLVRVPPDIWSVHGAERLHQDGKLEREELPSADTLALIGARELLQSIQLPQGIRIENKWNAVALRWRSISRRLSHVTSEYVEYLLFPFTSNSGLQLFPFDGGMELRTGHNKGDADCRLLKELPGNALVAYLGDDATDEYAFQALQGRGLCMLVRPRWRPAMHIFSSVRPHNSVASWLHGRRHSGKNRIIFPSQFVRMTYFCPSSLFR